MRRRTLLLAAFLALPGCHKEPSFEERYKATSTQIEKRARAIDAQIAGTGTPPPEQGEGEAADAPAHAQP